MRICQSPSCGKDISHMRPNAVYCSTNCRVNGNNARKRAANPRALTAFAAPSSAAGGDIGLALLEQAQINNELMRENNRLLGLLVGGGHMTVKETIIERQISINGGQPQPQLAPPIPTSEDDGELIQFVAPTKNLKSNSGRVLILQMLFTSYGYGEIVNVTDEDLEIMTGHPAFNQQLVQAELARRQGGAVVKGAPVKVSKGKDGPTAKRIKGSDVTFGVPDYEDDLDLI